MSVELRIQGPAVSGANKRRLMVERPGQAPLFECLEEAELLRGVRHQEVLRLLVVQASRVADLCKTVRQMVGVVAQSGLNATQARALSDHGVLDA
ncbi:hypothetical protein, partial [Streptomyces sp. NPDC056165]|uniref:hypothetical protein n=1 Tax=Streptomyces sp. NPDC056165 TaxID=3345733 RepID=UPI0035DC2FDD